LTCPFPADLKHLPSSAISSRSNSTATAGSPRNLTAGLKDPDGSNTDSDGARISLAELLNALDPARINTLIDAPKIVKAASKDSFGQFAASVSVDPISDMIDLGSDPTVTLYPAEPALSEHVFQALKIDNTRNFWVPGDQSQIIVPGALITSHYGAEIFTATVASIDVCGATKVTVDQDLRPGSLWVPMEPRK